jgi:hypothetical protein
MKPEDVPMTSEDAQYMDKREQNYMFAYNVVPAFLFRSDFAQITAFDHPNGFLYFQKCWERLALLFPAEHVVSGEILTTDAYQLSDGIYCLCVTMPPADRYLEVQFLGIVYHPKVRYFVAGRSDMGPGDSKSWTVREVTPNVNARSGGFRGEADSQKFLMQIAAAIGVEPKIRLSDGDEMKKNAERIETFPQEFQMTSPVVVEVIAATYKVISIKNGDTSGIPPAAVMEIYQNGGEPMQRVVEAIRRDAQQQGFSKQTSARLTPRTTPWWKIWK